MILTLDENALISTPYPRLNCLKTIPFTVHIVMPIFFSFWLGEPPSPVPLVTEIFLTCTRAHVGHGFSHRRLSPELGTIQERPVVSSVTSSE